MTSIAVVTESKNLYTNALVKLLTNVFYTFFKDMFKGSVKTHLESVYENFQKKLVDIKTWDSFQIKAFYNCCDLDKEYLGKLLLVIFKLNIKILSIINDSPVSSTGVPSLKQFMYKTLLNIAQELYQYPYVFDTDRKNQTNHDIAKNISRRRKIIHKSIINTIENYLPFYDIITKPQEIINVTTGSRSEETGSQTPSQDINQESSISLVLLESEAS